MAYNMSRYIKIGLAQIPVDNSIHEQYQKICDYTYRAETLGLDIICFPELSLGYGASDKNKELVIEYQKGISEQSYNVQIVYGSIRYEGDDKYISCFVCEDGKTEVYDKVYLGEKENNEYVCGEETKAFTNSRSQVKFSTLICYDMHFPTLCQIVSLDGASIVFTPHLMPRGDAQQRLELWKKYMATRAYDNRVYVASVNGMVNGCGGGAGIWDMDGNLLASHVDNKENILSCCIDLDELDSYRTERSSMKKRFFLKDLKEM